MNRILMILLTIVIIAILAVCLITIAGCADDDIKSAAQTTPQAVDMTAADIDHADADTVDTSSADVSETITEANVPAADETPGAPAEPAETEVPDDNEDTQALIDDIMDEIGGLDDMFDDDTDDTFMDID